METPNLVANSRHCLPGPHLSPGFLFGFGLQIKGTGEWLGLISWANVAGSPFGLKKLWEGTFQPEVIQGASCLGSLVSEQFCFSFTLLVHSFIFPSFDRDAFVNSMHL